MSKKNPQYENGWHSTGTLETLPSVDQVRARLEADPRVVLHARNFDILDGWWNYDAIWTIDGARVRARLQIHNRHPRNAPDPVRDNMSPTDYDPEASPLPGYFHVYAEADRPWDANWPSPLTVFLDRKLKPSYVSAEYGLPNLVYQKAAIGDLPALFQAVSALPWVAAILTHDTVEPEDVLGTGGSPHRYTTPLLSRLPGSLYGRVIEFRVLGEATRKHANRHLTKYGTELPEGGAAILLSVNRRKGIPRRDLTIQLDKSVTQGSNLAPLSDALVKLFQSGVMENDSDAMKELRSEWTLLTESEQLAKAEETIEELRDDIADLIAAVSQAQMFNDLFKENGQRLVEECQRAQEAEAQARERVEELRGEVNRLLVMIRDSDLGRAMEERDAALEDSEAAEELLDEQTRDLNELRHENDDLRRELARLGHTFTEAEESVEEPEVEPGSWDELLTWAATLEYVALGDVESGIDKLRGYEAERSFIRRSWEAMRALEDYARLKKELGSEALPHFGGYLEGSPSGCVIPRTRYSAAESKSVMMNGRMVAVRTLKVPKQVSESGKILMEAHIRIGSGKPPAPRMHFLDDTNDGGTGKIYVGHLGPHLLNYQSA